MHKRVRRPIERTRNIRRKRRGLMFDIFDPEEFEIEDDYEIDDWMISQVPKT